MTAVGFGFSHSFSYKQYKVTISEEVSFIEFNKEYELINQEGKIYNIIIKDKDR